MRHGIEERELALDLLPLFEQLTLAARDRDAEHFVEQLDLARMQQEMIALGIPLEGRARQQLEFQLRNASHNCFAINTVLDRWTDFEIQSVARLKENNSAVATVYLRDLDQEWNAIRFWLHLEGGEWRVYEIQHIEKGLRWTVAVLSPQGGLVDDKRWGETMVDLLDILRKVNRGEAPDDIELLLKKLAKTDYPRSVDAVRWMLTGNIQLLRHQDKEAVTALKKAQELDPDLIYVNMLLALAHIRSQEWTQALALATKYRDLKGENNITCRIVGQLLMKLFRHPEAAVQFRKALDLDAGDHIAFAALLESLGPEGSRDDLGMRFRRLELPAAHFEEMASKCRELRDGVALEAIAQTMRQIEPNHATADTYVTVARLLRGQVDGVLIDIRWTLARQNDPARRHDLLQFFAQTLCNQGKFREAYLALLDAREAFRYMAAALKGGYRMSELRQLVKLHAAKNADDPLLPFYRGDWLAQAGRYREAEKAFAQGMMRPPDAGTLHEFRFNRVLASFHLGKGLAALAQIEPRHETFMQLASLALNGEKYDLLQELLDAQAKAEPRDWEVLRYRFLLAVRQKRFDEAKKQFLATLEAVKDDGEKAGIIREFLLAMVAAGKPVEGYLAAPDPQQALQILVNRYEDDEEEEGQEDGLEEVYAAHARKFPDDPLNGLLRGESLVQAKEWDAAVKTFREARRKAPPELQSRYQYSYALALYHTRRGLDAYRECENKAAVFAQLAELMLQEKKQDELAALLVAHRVNDKASSDVCLVQARVALQAGRDAEAQQFLRQACEQEQQEWQKSLHVNTFMRDAIKLGRGLLAYRNAPDQEVAFQALAGHLNEKKQIPELRRLVDEHARNHPTDSQLQYYQATLQFQAGNVVAADLQFSILLRRATAQEKHLYQSELFRLRVIGGKAVATLEEFGDRSDVFARLASLCVELKNPAQLQALLAAYRRVDEDEPSLADWDLELLFLKRDYDTLVGRLAKGAMEAAQPGLTYYKRDDLLVRALIKLKRHEEALKTAQRALANSRGTSVLLVLAHAAQGDVPNTIKAMKKPQPYFIELCYNDPDLGPLLRSKDFRAFRDKYPEPPAED